MRFFRAVGRSVSFVGVLAALASSSAAQILQVDSDSVTTYRPTATSTVQGVRPIHLQRAVNLDGSARASGAIPAAIAGNPGENAWHGMTSMNGLNLVTGAYSPTDIDISLPTKGFAWVIGRSYNPRQENSSNAAMDSAGYQGSNWFQLSQPEILLYDDADNSKDTVYLLLGADRFVEFKRASSSSTQFSGRNGATGCFKFTDGGSGVADTYVLTDTRGTEFTFFGFDADAGRAAGQLWKIVDADSNTAYVGDSSSASTAITSGWETDGRIKVAYDSSDRRFTYTYSTLDSVPRLTEVKAETKTGGTWASPTGVGEVAKVAYAYYTNETYGDVGDLKQVTITKYLSETSVTQTLEKYYRYWEGTYDSTTNPGYSHAIQYVYEFEGIRRFDWADSTFDEDFLTATENSLKPYAAAYFEYDSAHKVRKAWFNGACGCGGGSSNGSHEFTYAAISYANNAGYDPVVALRTVVEKPNGSYLTQYFDETGQALSKIITDSDPSGSTAPSWATRVTRDSSGCVIIVATPAAATGYTFGTGDIAFASAAGLVSYFTRDTSTNTVGFLTERRHGIGLGTNGDGTNSGGGAVTKYLDEKVIYDSTTIAKTITDVTVRRPVITSRKRYPTVTTTDTGSEETTYSFATWSGATLSPETVTVTAAAVDSGKNGSGSTTVSSTHLRKDGLTDFEKRPSEGASYQITYFEYDKGQVKKHIGDADTGSADVTVSVPSGFASDGTVTKAAKKTDTTYTSSGLKEEVAPAGSNQKIERTYYSRLADHRLVVLNYAAAGSGVYYGPVSYEVVNHAGKSEVSGVIALPGNPGASVDPDTSQAAQSTHIDETDADPITAVDTSTAFGSLAQMTTSIYNESGTELQEERRYFLLPSSGVGTAGTNYDATKYGYDDDGHRVRVKEASGTIRRTVHDIFDRAVEQYIGTNDHSFAGGETSGTDNMTKTETLQYDSATTGKNGRLTKRTLHVDAVSGNDRVTEYHYDDLGRLIWEQSPTAPYAVHKYDNLGRKVATGLYSSTSGLSTSTDPTSIATNRLALNETLYDEQGRAWKTIRHNIDPADGSDDDTLETLTWYDSLGRVVKVDGEQLKKTKYDRLGRVTDEYILAKDNDTTYGNADDVSGDIVLEQRQTRFDPVLDNVIFTATISRFNTDVGGSETAGALDTNADGVDRKLTTADIKGRIQITAYWYDRTKRQTERVEYGTNGGSTLDFTTGMTSAPARSDTALRTSTTFYYDGTVDTVTDPRALVKKYVYDAMGRRTKEIRNYNAGVNSGNPSGTDDNVTVRYEYVNGLRTKLVADVPSPSTDQETVYTYGTTKGASAGDSNIATGHLLQKVTYPDSSSSTDVVTHAYNAQGEEIWKKDQAGNVYEMDFDARGRQTQRRVTTLASGFDGAIRRIGTTYDSLGRTQLVTQYDNATVGNGAVTDEVKYTYDGWGNLRYFEQDRDSAVGASGSVNDYEVQYQWTKATGGRNTIRKTKLFLPSGDKIGYVYSSTGGSHDAEVSRVTEMQDDARVVLARYAYNGVGHVVGTEYPEPQVMWNLYSGSGTSVTYPDLDAFNRVVKSRWTKDLSTDVDFYNVELTYDRNSNITSADDQVHTGFDVLYTMDDIDRLTEAKEGTLSGGSISSPTRDQQWTLAQTGNWDVNKVDLNGDLDFADGGEENDTRAHNAVNEITTRKSTTVSLAYDAAGNMTDDGVDYEYEWDAFYRLRKVKNQSSAVVAEYRYNGRGYRIGEHADTDTDGDVDGSDKWYFDAFDERWRQLARFRETDATPKEEFVPHQAGLDGRGGSSYIDLVVLRQKDADTAWTAATDGVREERIYYSQNWRADVSALISSGGQMLEWVKYSAYGVPFGLPAGDTNSDGSCDTFDHVALSGWASGYDVRYDVDLNGTIDASDVALAATAYSGRSTLSGTHIRSHIAFSGHRTTTTLTSPMRNREFSPLHGAWIARDPVTYNDGMSMYEYVGSRPVVAVDSYGRTATIMVTSASEASNEPVIDNHEPPRRRSVPKKWRPMPPIAPHGGAPFGAPTDEDCERWALSFNPLPERVWATAVCCNGKPHIVVLKKYSGPCSEANDIINQCVLEHENNHKERGDFGCDGVPDGFWALFPPVVGPMGSDNWYESESDSYRVEGRCLNRERRRCNGDSLCEDEIDLRERAVDNNRTNPPRDV